MDLTALRRGVEEAATGLRVDSLSAAQASGLLADLVAIERTAAGMKVLVAARAAEGEAWKASGHRSAAEWLANQSGSGIAEAGRVLDASARLVELPAVVDAVQGGALSQDQLVEVVHAASVAPNAASRLVEEAARTDLRGLRDECRKTKAANCPDEATRYERVRRARHLRWRYDAEGAFRITGSLTPDAGATLAAALAPFREQIFKAARKGNEREPYDALTADALVAMAAASGTPGPGPKATVVVRVDHAALMRGHSEDGEICEIRGVGPVPVAVARKYLDDGAFLKAVVYDGTEITKVKHFGRNIPAEVRTALEERSGGCCEHPGCSQRHHLQIDHKVPYAGGGPTSLENLQLLCPFHHRAKTDQDRKRGFQDPEEPP